MKVTKKTETLFEVEFDESEKEVMANMTEIFEQSPEEMITRSLEQSIKLLVIGTSNLIDKIHARLRDNSGD